MNPIVGAFFLIFNSYLDFYLQKKYFNYLQLIFSKKIDYYFHLFYEIE